MRSNPVARKEGMAPDGFSRARRSVATQLSQWAFMLGLALVLAGLSGASPLWAQVTPAEGHTGADDTPTFKVGVTIFANYTFQAEPQVLDVDGNEVNPSSFDITRAYINATGNINHFISYRVTPDIVRETTTGSVANVDGSLVVRLKYAFGQFGFDEAWTKGSWARLGLQQTPYIDYEENIYRYRFQGPIFVDAEKYMTSSDFAGSVHYNFPGNFGDVHAGIYNGDGYSKADANDEKAIQVRATLRPVPNGGIIKGLRITAFYDADHYASNDDRTRLVGNLTFEHRWVNAGAEYLDAHDQPNAAAKNVHGQGYSVWVTPRSTKGWEGLLRYDDLQPDTDVEAHKKRKVAGVGYWFPLQKPAAVSLLLDYEAVSYDELLGKPDEKRYALHSLFNF
jgi:hypothetical protein